MKNFNSSIFIIVKHLLCSAFFVGMLTQSSSILAAAAAAAQPSSAIADIKLRKPQPSISATFRKAESGDVQGVVALINAEAAKDSDKIVVVPRGFRTGYVEDAIRDGRLFVALHDRRIIGYKKLFCITDDKELRETVDNELRLNTKPAACASVAISDFAFLVPSSESEIPTLVSSLKSGMCIYNGADFTHPAYRGKKVNTGLTRYALDAVAPTMIEHMRNTRSTHLAMVYGLTQSNAGKETNLLDGRAHGIVKEFIPMAQKVAVASGYIPFSTMLMSRHSAFKPSFDPEATVCRPLPDDRSIPGYGCLVACPLVQQP